MDISQLRKQIDDADTELIRQFVTRMKISAQIAQYKQENNLPVLDPGREAQKLCDVRDSVTDEMKDYTESLYKLLFKLSRDYQSKLLTTPRCGL